VAHVRLQIRDAVLRELQPFADAGFLVSGRRVSNLDESELPAILVAVGKPNERSFPITMGNPAMGGAPTLSRAATLLISGVVSAQESDLDDLLESIAEQVEKFITQDHGGLTKSTLLTETTKEESAIGELPVAAISLDFEVIYHTSANDPSTSL